MRHNDAGNGSTSFQILQAGLPWYYKGWWWVEPWLHHPVASASSALHARARNATCRGYAMLHEEPNTLNLGGRMHPFVPVVANVTSSISD